MFRSIAGGWAAWSLWAGGQLVTLPSLHAEPTVPVAGSGVRCDAQGCTLGACVTHALLTEPATLLRDLRVIPRLVDGQTRGFKLFAIRPGSLAAQLGAQNGDVLASLNGLRLDDPATAQAAWDAAQTKDQWVVSLLRADQPMDRVLRLQRSTVRPTGCPPPSQSLAPDPHGASPRSVPASSSASGAQLTSVLRGIRCQGDTCTLPRSTLDAVLADSSLLMRSARAVPAQRDGKVRGFALFGIRPGTLFDRLGLRNGDVITGMAGRSLDSPEAALELYASLRSAKQLAIDIERSGRPQTRTYHIESSHP